MKYRYVKTALLAALLSGYGASHAEDIDLFVDNSNTADLPNVLFIIDNTANWTQAFTNEVAALRSTFLAMETAGTAAKFNVGVMFAAETSSSDSSVQGGYVRAAIRPMTDTNKTLYANMINALDVNKDKGNSGQSSLVMAEAYRYFSAGLAYSGKNKAKTDYDGNTAADWSSSATSAASKTAMQAIYLLDGNALNSKSASNYNPPPLGSGCGKNFIIYISNGPSQDSNAVLTQAKTMLSDAGGSTTQIPLTPTGSQSNVSDEWARFMFDSREIVTYTIEVNPGTTGQGPGWTELLKSMAIDESRYYAVSSSTGVGDEIAKAIGTVLSKIQAVNSAFASVSLPVSVNTQGTYLNQVYIGMFRPDRTALPRWVGNLKQYKLGLSNGALRLQDADDQDAIESQTGFLEACARSFWTSTTADTYWSFKPQGACGVTAAEKAANQASDSPDGSIVEKGAQGHMLRSTSMTTSGSTTTTSRVVKTCSPTFASCTSLTDFDLANTAITQSLLGASSATERDALIEWARGVDNKDEDTNASTAGVLMRPSVHGDVVHSRPVAINIGTAAAPDVVVIYGGNDGVLRAVNGNRSTALDSTPAGGELWAFIPPEFYGQFKRLRDNTTLISFPNVTSGTPLPKPYSFDGPITADVDTSSARIYATMRRGGRALYAFNMPFNDPSNTTLLWKRGCPNNFPTSGSVSDTDCLADFEGIGQTWSAPRIFKAPGYSSGASSLLVMGGGYDTCEDVYPATCTASSKGTKVYVFDAVSGTRLTTLNTDRSVVADVVVVPDSVTGLASFAYVVDLGGNVYRIDMRTGTPDTWVIIKIASLGCDTIAPCTENRKFMFAPDVLQVTGGYVLLLGSGDREKPRFNTNPVDNYFFMLKDQPTNTTWLTSETGNCSGDTVLCLNSLLAITAGTPTAADLATKKGWYLDLDDTEQVVTSAITIFGTVTFSTHMPPATTVGQCSSDLGTARVYNVSYLDAAGQNDNNARYEELPSDIGLPPSPVAGMVTLDDGTTVPFCIGCNPDSPLEAEEPPIPPSSTPAQPKGRVYWYIEH